MATWLGIAATGAVAAALGVGAANVATHFSRAWFGTLPNTEFFVGLGGFFVGGGVPLVVAALVYSRAARAS